MRSVLRTGAIWRLLAHDFPPWNVVYQQAQCWLAAGCRAAPGHDLRPLFRAPASRCAQPTAVIRAHGTAQSTPESRAHAGYDCAKRR